MNVCTYACVYVYMCICMSVYAYIYRYKCVYVLKCAGRLIGIDVDRNWCSASKGHYSSSNACSPSFASASKGFRDILQQAAMRAPQRAFVTYCNKQQCKGPL